MSYETEAAEGVTKIALDGFETAARIGGDAALRLSKLLIDAIRHPEAKNSYFGPESKRKMGRMLLGDTVLKIAAVYDDDLRRFTFEARLRGIDFCAIKDPYVYEPVTDVVFKASDAYKVTRLFEDMKLKVPEFATLHYMDEYQKKNAADLEMKYRANELKTINAERPGSKTKPPKPLENPTEDLLNHLTASEDRLSPTEEILSVRKKQKPSVIGQIRDIRSERDAAMAALRAGHLPTKEEHLAAKEEQ